MNKIWRALTKRLLIVFIFIIILLASASYLLISNSDEIIDVLISALDDNLTESVALAVGASLIGATAFVFSLVLFAMQVNVERMPHGLFRRLSRDMRLLGAFLLSFLLAIGVAFSPVLLPPIWQIWLAFWSTVGIILLYFIAYERSLRLINPIQQLTILARSASRDLERWGRHARRLSPFYAPSKTPDPEDAITTRHDMGAWLFFRQHPHWTASGLLAIDYAISMSRRAIDQGDYEASSAALKTLAVINHAYIRAKGRTFFAQTPFLSNPLTSDGFINHTLEHLRQTTAIGISRRDERQIQQAFQAYVDLTTVYLQIDYAQDHADHSQATLSAGYLASDVKRVADTDLTDVVMNGARQIGQVAIILATRSKPEDTHTLIDALGEVGRKSVIRSTVNDISRAATGTVVGQLSRLFNTVLVTDHQNVRFSLSEIQREITDLASLILLTPDTPLASAHSSTLSPFYGLTDESALVRTLERLNQALLARGADDREAKRILRNLCSWSDGLVIDQRELLQKSIEKKSHFTFDLTHWLINISKLLMQASTAAACSNHDRGELRKHARWLASSLSWIPSDAETIRWVETYRITEQLFDVADAATLLGLEAEDREHYCGLLLDWSFKAGRDRGGDGIMERGLYALAALAIRDETTPWLLARLKAKLDETTVSQEERQRVASNIRRKARSSRYERYTLSRSEAALQSLDIEQVEACLLALAELLSPGTDDGSTDEIDP